MGEQQWETLSNAIEFIEASESRESLFTAVKAYVSKFGAEHVGIGQLINPALATSPLENYGISDFPSEFTDSWFDKKLIMHDPITRYAARARNAFTWELARKFASKFGVRMMDMASDLSLKAGLGVPVVIPNMPVGLITMSHPDADFTPRHVVQIELVCIHAYIRFLDLIEAQPATTRKPLTDRETEVLHYVAAGRTNWEIGEILSISEETVRVHTKNIIRKLNAMNRAHSVTIALQGGSIMP